MVVEILAEELYEVYYLIYKTDVIFLVLYTIKTDL